MPHLMSTVQIHNRNFTWDYFASKAFKHPDKMSSNPVSKNLYWRNSSQIYLTHTLILATYYYLPAVEYNIYKLLGSLVSLKEHVHLVCLMSISLYTSWLSGNYPLLSMNLWFSGTMSAPYNRWSLNMCNVLA